MHPRSLVGAALWSERQHANFLVLFNCCRVSLVPLPRDFPPFFRTWLHSYNTQPYLRVRFFSQRRVSEWRRTILLQHPSGNPAFPAMIPSGQRTLECMKQMLNPEVRPRASTLVSSASQCECAVAGIPGSDLRCPQSVLSLGLLPP